MKNCPDFDLTLEEFTNVTSLTDSLSFMFTKAGHPTCAFLPLTDKFNFGDDTQTLNYFNNEEKGWSMIARKEIVRGNEIHISTLPGIFLDNGFFL